MFVLSVAEEEVAIPPSRLTPGQHIAEVRALLEAKFVDRMVPNLGLVVAVYDILRLKDPFIFPGDFRESQGEAACTVVFRLVVFRPSPGEVLLGKIKSNSTAGISINVSDLLDVEVPAQFLQQPAIFDERSRTWVWQFESADGKRSNLFYETGDDVLCTVTCFNLGPDKAAFRVVASMDQIGTGPLKWWL